MVPILSNIYSQNAANSLIIFPVTIHIKHLRHSTYTNFDHSVGREQDRRSSCPDYHHFGGYVLRMGFNDDDELIRF